MLAAALLAFADVEMDEDPSPVERAAVVQAVTRLARCVRVFVNRGSIRHGAGARPNRLFGFFDRVVRDVTLVGASLHAKVWVLKYVPQGRPELSDSGPIYRFLCSSRNLSTSRAWELGLRPDGTAGGEGSELGRSLGDFCRTMLRQDAPPPNALVALAREIETIRFVTDREMESRLEFLWQWPGRPGLYRHLPAKGRRALLVCMPTKVHPLATKKISFAPGPTQPKKLSSHFTELRRQWVLRQSRIMFSVALGLEATAIPSV